MMLETAQEMNELGVVPRNKVRFIFFSGEEQGLLGSDYYVSQLSKRQIKDISVMLDFDMRPLRSAATSRSSASSVTPRRECLRAGSARSKRE